MEEGVYVFAFVCVILLAILQIVMIVKFFHIASDVSAIKDFVYQSKINTLIDMQLKKDNVGSSDNEKPVTYDGIANNNQKNRLNDLYKEKNSSTKSVSGMGYKLISFLFIFILIAMTVLSFIQ